MPAKPHASSRDRLAANLVLIAIFGMILLGAAVLYLTGIFDPAEGQAVLDDTPPLPLTAQPPKREGLMHRLFPSASAEEAALEPDVLPEAEPAQAAAGGADLESLLASLLEEEKEEDALTEADIIKFDENDLSLNTALPADWTNLLLLGTDSRDYNARTGNTDLMLIASVNEKTGEVKMISLARDLYVQIPGATASSRINTAYAYGGGGKSGARLAMKTVNTLFELNIQYYAVVNFADVAAIVDSLGGVDIPIVGEEYRYINEYVAVGEEHEGFQKSAARHTLREELADTTVHLDGLQALSYARIRKLDNDLQRGSRHRILLGAVLDKVMATLSPSTIISLSATLVPHTDTNFPIPTEGMRLGVGLLWADSVSVMEMSIPVEGSFHYAVEKGRGGVDIEVIAFSQQTNTQALHEFIFGEYIPREPAQ